MTALTFLLLIVATALAVYGHVRLDRAMARLASSDSDDPAHTDGAR